jgi:hypothetical protein
MIKWIFYTAGIIFLVLFIISMVKPILFKEKWQAGLGYGISAALYLGLFFLIFFGEYNATTSNAKTVNAKTSNTTVNGSVTALEPRSAKQSVFQDIPVQEIDVTPIQDVSTSNTSTTTNNGNQYVDANGNGTIVGDTGKKIYYLPGEAYYSEEVKNANNAVYFKTIAEAEAGGYKAIDH